MKFVKTDAASLMYNILFVVPREILMMMDSLFVILSLGTFHSGLYWKGIEAHMRWAYDISSKFKTKKDDDI